MTVIKAFCGEDLSSQGMQYHRIATSLMQPSAVSCKTCSLNAGLEPFGAIKPCGCLSGKEGALLLTPMSSSLNTQTWMTSFHTGPVSLGSSLKATKIKSGLLLHEGAWVGRFTALILGP